MCVGIRRGMAGVLGSILTALTIATPSAPVYAIGQSAGEIRTALVAQIALETGDYRVSVRELGGDNRAIEIDSDHSMDWWARTPQLSGDRTAPMRFRSWGITVRQSPHFGGCHKLFTKGYRVSVITSPQRTPASSTRFLLEPRFARPMADPQSDWTPSETSRSMTRLDSTHTFVSTVSVRGGYPLHD